MELEPALLKALQDAGEGALDSSAFAAERGVPHEDVVGLVRSLLSADMVQVRTGYRRQATGDRRQATGDGGGGGGGVTRQRPRGEATGARAGRALRRARRQDSGAHLGRVQHRTNVWALTPASVGANRRRRLGGLAGHAARVVRHPRCGSSRTLTPPLLAAVVQAEDVETSGWALTAEGDDFVANGTAEARVYQAVPADGVPLAELKVWALRAPPDLGTRAAAGPLRYAQRLACGTRCVAGALARL